MFIGDSFLQGACVPNENTIPSVFEKLSGENAINLGMISSSPYDYLNTLKKNEKKINEFLENWPNENKNADDVIRMIRLNKSREKMRNALGMDLNTSVEDALEIYWVMGSFLDLGVAKKQKISKDLKLRKQFLAEYKQTISKFNSEFKKNKDQSLYDAIEEKD